MPDYVLANLPAVLEARGLPTITAWNRLEGRPRREDFARALKAEVRDALFLLGRQWQMGEFIGDDAGSPAVARIQLETTELTTYQPARGVTRRFDDTLPLEARVERRALPLAMGGRAMSLDIRLLMGRQWLRMTRTIGNYAAAFTQKYRIAAPDPAVTADAPVAAHGESFELVAALAGRRMDGGAFYAWLKGGAGRHPYDGIAAILPVHYAALDTAAMQFITWFETTFTQPPPDEDAWLPDRLEYQFACAAPRGGAEAVFIAREYSHGHLDWYNLDIDRARNTLGAVADPVPDPQGTTVLATIPVPIAYDGMPNTRWWTFEDRRVNFGQVSPATTDLGKLMFLEFGLVYANDWFMLPLTLDAGSVARVRGMAVTTVFGERFWIPAAGAGPDDDWQRWSMFTLSVDGRTPGQRADTSLLLLPTVPKIQEGPPLEEVLLVRDEVANMVWAVEKTVMLPTGSSKPGREAGLETLAYHTRLLAERLQASPAAPPGPPVAPIIYKVMNTVPENWIPFVPVHVPGDNRATQLQRAAMPRLLDGDPDDPERVRPRTVLLREGLEGLGRAPYFLHEEEVPRAGAIVSQAYQRTRWNNGRVLVWLGARKQTGRGEGSSGLAFDRLVSGPAPPP